jgi:DNA-binding NtrC family response regulator
LKHLESLQTKRRVLLARILAVEDDYSIRLLLQHVLLDAGHSVIVSETVRDALHFIASHPFDLVVADGVLPDGLGITVADTARDRGIPALVITGRVLSLPMDDLLKHEFLLKPVRPDELVRVINRRLPANLAG